MFNYHCLNPISDVGLEEFTEEYVPVSGPEKADALLVRSAVMHEMEFGKELKAIARAGAGVNNIPLDRCTEEGIVVFNTPGANANGVKELVIAGMLLASRDIIGGINWVEENEEDGNIAKDAEKAKKQFAGCELDGKKLGVIGLGAIGVLVANAATHLGMEVYGYDPYISVKSAWNLSRNIRHASTVDELYKECDYITVHVPAAEDTRGMIDQDAISLIPGTARGHMAIYCNADVHSALNQLAARADSNVITLESGLNRHGEHWNWRTFMGVPLRRVDQIVNNETRVTK